MSTLARLSPWFTRLVLLSATLLFAMIGRKYVFDPVAAVRDAGIGLNTPMALTTMRASFGAFPLACSASILVCLLSTRRNRIGLWFIAILIGIVLAVRLYGIVEDGTLRENRPVLIAETVLFSVTVAALLMGRAVTGPAWTQAAAPGARSGRGDVPGAAP